MKKLVRLFIVVSFCYSCVKKEEKTILISEVYSLKNGYGYKIYLRNKLLINQNCIPVIQENRPFCDSIDAVIMSRLVIRKINNRQNPSITKNELRYYKIKTKC